MRHMSCLPIRMIEMGRRRYTQDRKRFVIAGRHARRRYVPILSRPGIEVPFRGTCRGARLTMYRSYWFWRGSISVSIVAFCVAAHAAFAAGGWESGDEQQEAVANAVGRLVEQPPRGNSATFPVDHGADSWCWIDATYATILHPFYDTLLRPNWTALSQGTGEIDYNSITADFHRHWIPNVIESLGTIGTVTDTIEIQSLDSLVMRVRRGVRFWDINEVKSSHESLHTAYGRELDAYDIVDAVNHLKHGHSDEIPDYTTQNKRFGNGLASEVTVVPSIRQFWGIMRLDSASPRPSKPPGASTERATT